LTGPGANAQVKVVHLPAGGLVGRREATQA
jgi:hypothetical protein